MKLHIPCPECGSSDALSVYEDGGAKCFSCGKFWKHYGEEKEVIVSDKNILEDMGRPAVDGIPDRYLTPSTCEKYGVRVVINKGGIAQHIYPYFNKDSKYCASKIRTVEGKQFHWKGNAQQATLFGQNLFPSKGRFITVTEGEIDAMSIYQIFNGKSAVVSLKGGVNSIQDIKNNYQYLDGFDNIILCYDGDDVGQKNMKKAAAILPPKKVKMVKLPPDMKDANEFLKAGKADEFSKLWWKAEEYRPEDIVNYSDLWERIEDFGKNKQYIETPWIGLNEKICGFRPSQFIVMASGCVSAETEFFTGYGWKKISDYTEGDKVLQFNMDTEEAELVTPLEYIKKPCEWVYKFKTKYGLDMELSPEHNILYKPEGSNNMYKISAQDVAEKCPEFRGRIPTSFNYSAEGLNLSDTDIKIMLAAIADGYIRYKKIVIQIKKERKKKELKKLLTEWGKPYKWYDYSNGYSVVVFTPPRLEKTFTKDWYKCSNEQLQLICNNVLKWDGHIAKNYLEFYTNIKASADFIQFAFSSCGYRARIYTRMRDVVEYVVHITKRTLVGMRRAPKPTVIKTTDGFKYCFTVPSSCLVLRNNGCIFCTGNTGMGKSSFLKTLIHHYLKTTDYKIGAFFLEEVAEDTAISLMSLEAGLNLRKPEIWKEQDTKDLKKWFEDSGADRRLELYDGFDFDDIDLLLNKIRYLVRARDCKIIILDHLTMVVDDAENPTQALNKLVADLKKIAVELDIIILSACHLRKAQNAAHQTEEGGRVTLDDLKQSSSIKQLADVVIGLERNGQSDDMVEANTTRIRVLKDRDFGSKGLASAVIYDKNTTRLQEVDLDFTGD